MKSNPKNPNIAVALDVAKRIKNKCADGGAAKSDGRSDDIALSVPSGAHVIPADVVSGLGRGDTSAGAELLSGLFPSDDDAGASGIPIAISRGEYVISPSAVLAAGDGDMAAGHNALNEFIKEARAFNIERLKTLKTKGA